MKTKIDFHVGWRNGVGIDLSALPKQHGVAYKAGKTDYNLLTINLLQLLLPFIFIQVGTITAEPISRAQAEELGDDDTRGFYNGE